MNFDPDRRPVIVVVAGPNGAGKTTFFEAFLKASALRFVNADILARELNLGAYEAAELAAMIRSELVFRRESFVFETVLSDPEGTKVEFLRKAAESGYTVVFCFIGVDAPGICDERVAMRVMQGGHDVPMAKILGRYPRALANLARAIRDLPFVAVYDNSDLSTPFRRVAVFRDGRLESSNEPWPGWFKFSPEKRPAPEF